MQTNVAKTPEGKNKPKGNKDEEQDGMCFCHPSNFPQYQTVERAQSRYF